MEPHGPNKEERLVKQAAREQHATNEGGNLFMDAPKSASFEELEELAKDRDAWKRLVAKTFGEEVKLPPKMSVRATYKLNAGGKAGASAKAKIKTKYQKRDDTEMFFRRGGSDRARQLKKKKTKKAKPRSLTNKERQAAARQHWELHHGDEAAAAMPKKTAAPIVMTTEEAMAAVFSSDEDSSTDMEHQPARSQRAAVLLNGKITGLHPNNNNQTNQHGSRPSPMPRLANFHTYHTRLHHQQRPTLRRARTRR